MTASYWTGRTVASELGSWKQAGAADGLEKRVRTDNGRDLGRVVCVVLHSGAGMDVVGYEVEASEVLGTAGRHVFLPLPDTVAVSGETLTVPASAPGVVAEHLRGCAASAAASGPRLRAGA